MQNWVKSDIMEEHRRRVKNMPKPYHFSEEQIKELEESRKKNKNKTVEKRLQTLLLRAQCVKRKEIVKITGFSISHITQLTYLYKTKGIKAITNPSYGGNNRNMSFEEESRLLEAFIKEAKEGKIVEVSEILHAYEKKLGRTFEKSHSQIYDVLHRHNWRKVMPRSQHPNKASDEVINTSKKLTQKSKN